jgi:hypothetical protein
MGLISLQHASGVISCRDHIYLRDAREGVPLLLPANHDNWFVGDFAAFREVVFPHYLLHDKLGRCHLPLALNLNTSTETELMTVPGISHSLAAAIVRLRGNLGYLRRLADLESVPGMTPDVMAKLQSMTEDAERFGGYVRE